MMNTVDGSEDRVDERASEQMLDERLREGLAAVKRLRENQSGADKTWVMRLVQTDEEYFARVVRIR